MDTAKLAKYYTAVIAVVVILVSVITIVGLSRSELKVKSAEDESRISENQINNRASSTKMEQVVQVPPRTVQIVEVRE